MNTTEAKFHKAFPKVRKHKLDEAWELLNDQEADREEVLQLVNDLLGGHGVEGITPDGRVYPVAAYINFGDPYDTTILHDVESDEFILTNWGDWLEKWEAKNL